jgi:amino acid adenylation domain-containing protein
VNALTIVDLFLMQVSAAPDAPAIVLADLTLTYRDVDLASDQIAAVVLERGVLPQEAVAVSVARVDVAICALLGAMKAGAAVLLLDPDHPRSRQIQLVTDARCVLVVSDDAQELTDAVPAVSPGSSPSVKTATASGSRAAPSHAAYIVYTSGSTGVPKGVVCGHASLANVARAQRGLLGVRPDDRVAVNAPMTVDAFYFEIALALGAGASLQVPGSEQRRPGPRFRRFLHERGITVLVCTPTKLRTLDPADHKGLRLVISAGEALDVGLGARWAPGRRLVNAYGPTEATIWTTMADVSGAEREISLGAAIPGCRVEVLRSDLTQTCADEPGELFISGAGLALGYVRDPGNDRFVILNDGRRAYRTGDRAVRRSNGSLIFAGRDDDQVKVSGFRVELGEIQHHLRQHDQVGDAVVRVDDGRLVAYVTPPAGGAARAEPPELRRFLENRLPPHMVPVTYVWLPAMPETSWGKVDVASLPALAEASSRSGAGRPARTSCEQYLVNKVGEMLRTKVNAEDDLFLRGLESVLIATLMNHVKSDLQVELKEIDVFDHPTIAGLAEHIEKLKAAAGQEIGLAHGALSGD